MTGRPSLLEDPDRRRSIIDAVSRALEAGSPQSTAAEAAGISESTFYLWMQLGDEGAEPFSEFSEAVRRSRVGGEIALLERVKAHSDEDGPVALKAATWLLERRWPEKYGASVTLRKAEENVMGALLGQLRERLDPATFARVLEALAADEGPGDAESRGAGVH